MTTKRAKQGGASRSLTIGVMAGAALGAGWVFLRRYGRDRVDDLFDWDRVSAVALGIGARGGQLPAATRAHAEAEYAEVLGRIADPLAEYTGTTLELKSLDVQVLDRRQWISANIATFRRLFGPIEDYYRASGIARGTGLPGLAAFGRAAVSTEVGLLLGYLARRVLGQYDITLLSQGPAEPGKLYFVEPNVQAVQLHLGLPRREFRLWLALHELAHAHEFEGHPWVREYLDANVQEYLRTMAQQLTDGNGSFLASVGEIGTRLFGGESLIEATMTPAQRDVFLRLQALMTVLEGYSTHIMSALGRSQLAYYQQIEDRVEDRLRHKTAAEQLFLRLTGLQLKLDQYRLGAAFVARVEQERGKDFVNRVWEGVGNLPTLEEVREPERWIQRLEEAAV